MAAVNSADGSDLWGAPFHGELADSEPMRELHRHADVLTERTKGRIIGFVRVQLIWPSLMWIGLTRSGLLTMPGRRWN
jgi:hypothetical protein